MEYQLRERVQYAINNKEIDVSPLIIDENALTVMKKRYLLKDVHGNVTESPTDMFIRVALKLALVDLTYETPVEAVYQLFKNYYRVMKSGAFLPAGRTLANHGMSVPNCIVLHINDSLSHIFQTLMDAALLQKQGCGLGFPLHLMRPTGDRTISSGGESSGPISFLHVYNEAFATVKQQSRHGANMAIMKVTHPDILEFIHCKEREGELKNFNISVALTNEFMCQVKEDCQEPWKCEFNGKEYPLRNIKRGPKIPKYHYEVDLTKKLPQHVTEAGSFACINEEYYPLKRVEERTDVYTQYTITEVKMTARQLFQEIISCAWKNGEPGCVFIDKVNETNPLPSLGPIEASNPCVTADTWIETVDGPRQVSDIIGQPTKLLTWHGVVDSKGFFSTGVKEVFKVSTSAGFELKATKDHHLMTPRGWTTVGSLVEGTELSIVCSDYAWTEEAGDDVEKMSREAQIMFLKTCFSKATRIEGVTYLENKDISFLKKVQRMLRRTGTMSYIKENILEARGHSPGNTTYETFVTSVESIGKQEVFDTTVLHESHCYLSNGFISHNCSEQFLHDGDVCNLGSVNMACMIKEGKLDKEKLKHAVHYGTRMLDCAIDTFRINIQRVQDMSRKTRRCGLGIMGFAEYLLQLNIPYNSPEALSCIDEFMSIFRQEAIETSRLLAGEKGVFPLWKESIYAEKDDPRRNAFLTCIAPTGATSMLITPSISGGCEPVFAWAYNKSNIMGGMSLPYHCNYYLEKRLKEAGIWSEELIKEIIRHGSIQKIEKIPPEIRRVFVCSHDVSPEWHILIQAKFQEYIDNSISKTANFPNSATKDDVAQAYLKAWEMGCKGLTVYRDGSRVEQVLELVVNHEEKNKNDIARVIDEIQKTSCPDCMTFENIRAQEGCVTCTQCGWSKCC